MNDFSAVPRLSNIQTEASFKAAKHLGSIAEASALCAHLTVTAPSLRDVAHGLLSSRLQGLVEYPNPDILFLNTRGSKGSIARSMSLTDGLLHALIHGTSTFEKHDVAVYVHHDSVRDAHLIASFTVEDALQLFNELVQVLPTAYTTSLVEFWTSDIDIAAHPSENNHQPRARHVTLTDLRGRLLTHEAALNNRLKTLDLDASGRLNAIVTGASTAGVYSLSLTLPEGTSVALHSVFVATQLVEKVDVLTPDQEVGAAFLYTPARGLEVFDSLAQLNESVVQLLANPDEQAFLLQNLLLADRDGLDDNAAAIAGMTPCYNRLDDPLLIAHTQGIRDKQSADFNHVLTLAQRTKEEMPAFLAQVKKIQCLDYCDHALWHRFEEHCADARQKRFPDWLKDADDWKKDSYQVFETQHHEYEQAADQLLGTLGSLKSYSVWAIDQYVRQHLGYSVDPQQIFITLPDEFPTQAGTFKTVYKKSLLEFVMEGLPFTDVRLRPSVEVPARSEHPAWTYDFADKLVAELDVRINFGQAVRALYQQPEMQRALLHVRDSAITLSAWAAKLQGHLLDRSEELIRTLSSDNVKPGYLLSIGHVTLNGSSVRLKDLIVFHEVRDADEHYVLYAPGAPGGRDMFEFSSWRSLSFEIGGWTKTAAGAQYLVDQVPLLSRAETSVFISSITHLPSKWQPLSVRFMPGKGKNYEANLLELVNHKVDVHVADNDVITPADSKQGTYAHRRSMVVLESRITEINKAFLAITKLRSFQQIAHDEIKRVINNWLRQNGVNERIDPDTVYVDVHGKPRLELPNLGPDSPFPTLTRLAMDGYSGNYKFHQDAVLYSSIGQDLSGLPTEVIDRTLRVLSLGERYMKMLEVEYLDKKHQYYKRRRALYAVRQHCELRHAIMSEYLRGRLTQTQYQWLVHLVVSLGASGLADEPKNAALIENSSVNAWYLEGRLVEGVYLFKNSNNADPDFELLYTPNAPDGLLFRTNAELISSALAPGMADYYYDRVRYKHQPVINAYFASLKNTPPVAGMSFKFEFNPADQIKTLERLYDDMIQRMIQDIDDQTESTDERIGQYTYIAVKWTGTILLLPFPGASVAWGLLHSGISFQRGLIAYLDGDRATAFPLFVGAAIGVVSGADGIRSITVGSPTVGRLIANWAWVKTKPFLVQHFTIGSIDTTPVLTSYTRLN
ncbi:MULTISPECIES: DUF6543 domain-containing protein [unclassified Pseudomonas]|uniref:dermonecrotic toxin domain-containing protein n=1 Tax=unclassified Pseudomonas TaxID=196821 RepID=UPI002AC9DEB8|nr:MULTISPECIES: DUF6543 domain-containing protein [unclassified Pseudomonas]MEB0042744.1 hypothetical protein [Pseudomonas sp. MH10]MEB0121657.1 hypothetical protein [Pseudomonas sp. CCI1.2]WPX66246.1 hypothetical protein RHM59_11640 [Pseudomonas sp. MH10]